MSWFKEDITEATSTVIVAICKWAVVFLAGFLLAKAL